MDGKMVLCSKKKYRCLKDAWSHSINITIFKLTQTDLKWPFIRGTLREMRQLPPIGRDCTFND